MFNISVLLIPVIHASPEISAVGHTRPAVSADLELALHTQPWETLDKKKLTGGQFVISLG